MTEEMNDRYQERAAIMEFEGGIPREKAEALAQAEAETWAAHHANKEAA